MNKISRYILREHVGPLLFAFTALTSLMLLNFISRQFGELVGKGLPASAIGQFFLLSLPFTVALTIPMSVLVAVLYAYSRLASESEITAMKASGLSPFTLVAPALYLGAVLSILMLAFNDYVLPRANHQLKNLQDDISQAKPTLLLKETVINPVAEGKLYLKADKIDGGRLKGVVIYDLANTQRRRTIYADSGRIAFAQNRKDLDMTLYSGQMFEVSLEKPNQLDRMFYKQDRIRVKDVGRDYRKTSADSTGRGDREMGVCEMQRRYWVTQQGYVNAKNAVEFALRAHTNAMETVKPVVIPEPMGLGWAYCALLRNLRVPEAHAQQPQVPVPQQQQQGPPPPVDVSKLPPSSGFVPNVPNGGLPPQGAVQNGAPAQAQSSATPKTQEQIAAEAAREMMQAAKPATAPPPAAVTTVNENSSVVEARLHLAISERQRNRYEIEINKKFSLAAACIIFCILGPPIALRFPRGGVGLVIGVSLAVFALYYVGLIGGEALANKSIVPPFWAMWITNILLTLFGVILLLRVGRGAESGRGGGIREWLSTRRLLREERLARAAGARA